LRALQYGYRFVIFESGDDIASNVRSWSHVRLFTPLSMNMSSVAPAYVETNNDDNAYLTGNEYIERYLRPFSCHLQPNIRLRHRIISVDRHHTNGFVILVENGQTNREEYIFMDCVIDASGTYGCPNFAGPGKLPAINERTLRMAASPIVSYRVPSERDEYLAGKRILLIGKGHSAATSAVFLGKHMS
jgi:cation diffusion facilitator CzcD-associated flavoprotein CzcO